MKRPNKKETQKFNEVLLASIFSDLYLRIGQMNSTMERIERKLEGKNGSGIPKVVYGKDLLGLRKQG